MVVMNFLWWFLFEHITDNAVLAIGFVFVMERSLRSLRAFLGKKNLVKKSYVDERFLN
jgi:hypothetical protein